MFAFEFLSFTPQVCFLSSSALWLVLPPTINETKANWILSFEFVYLHDLKNANKNKAIMKKVNRYAQQSTVGRSVARSLTHSHKNLNVKRFTFKVSVYSLFWWFYLLFLIWTGATTLKLSYFRQWIHANDFV